VSVSRGPFQVNQQSTIYSFEIVEAFTYLGICLTSKNEIRPKTEKIITTANRAYYALHPILKSQSVYRNTTIIIYKTLIRPIITYGAEAWTMSSETGKWLAVFERKVLRKILGTIKVNNCWRRRHNNELMQLYGDLDIVSFIRINRLRWISHVNIMDNERMVCQAFANQPQGSRPRGRPKCRWWDCVYGDIRKSKIRNWEQRSKNREDWMRSIKAKAQKKML
jgi:hypothetical protein